MRKKILTRTLAVLSLGGLVLALPAGPSLRANDDDTSEAKAIYLDGEKNDQGKPGMKFSVMLKRGNEPEKRVRTSYEFKSQDRMLFEFEVNKPQYVYVLNRTIPQSQAPRYAGKGIGVVRDDDRKPGGDDRSTRYKLLFPTQEAGTNNKLLANKAQTIPPKVGNQQTARFVMDNNPGIEKLYVVTSSAPIDISKYFDLTTGNVRNTGTRTGAGKGLGDEGDEDGLDELNKDLAEWGGNADVSMAKGINTESYGINQNPAKPMMVEVDLTHSAK